MILRIRNHDNRRVHDHRLREDEVEKKAPLGTRKDEKFNGHHTEQLGVLVKRWVRG